MKQYDTFIIDTFDFDPKTAVATFTYSLDNQVFFSETLHFPKEGLRTVELPLLDRALLLIHIIGGVSYYKTCCPKTIEVRSGALSKEQATFFREIYENGLGEFFYENKIDFRGLVNFPVNPEAAPTPLPAGLPRRTLVPIGGGKDSIVTMELLKKAKENVTLFRMGKHPLIDACADKAGLQMLSVERRLSPALFKLNAEGALNGHVPISAYLSTVTVLTSLLYGFDTVVMSNERSANEGNVEYLGKEINHQWSKSLAFERMFQEELARSVTTELSYFSLLRPLSELSIAKLACSYPQYFPYATSCNANWKIAKDPSGSRWCGMCPKCAFAFALYAAFLPKEELKNVFGSVLFDHEEDLMPFYRELLGLEGFKPFECVGTVEETKAAFYLAHERGDLEDTAAMKMFVKEVLPTIKDPKKLLADLQAPGTEHAIPKKFQHALV